MTLHECPHVFMYVDVDQSQISYSTDRVGHSIKNVSNKPDQLPSEDNKYQGLKIFYFGDLVASQTM